MKTKRLFSAGRAWAGMLALTMAVVLPGCNGGDDNDSTPATTAGSTTTTTNVTTTTNAPPTTGGRVNIQGPEGSAIALPANPADIIPANATIDLNGTVAYNASTGRTTIHFFYKDEAGNGISLTKNPVELRFYSSELVPDTQALVNPGLAWNQLIYESGTPGDPADDGLPGILTVIDGSTGEYAYQLSEPLPQSNNVTRVTVRARWRMTVGDDRYYVLNSANASYDFLQSDPGTGLAASGADMVDTQACDGCHGVSIGGVGHGGGYTEVKSCNNCHNVNYMGDGEHTLEADLAFMVHRIHNAGVFAELDGGIDFSELTYPQETSTCETCHADSAPNRELAFTNPTRSNCGSCHASVNFETGENHPGGAFQDDSTCDACHQPNGISGFGGIPGTDHKSMIAGSGLAPKPENIAEYDVNISMQSPANGQYYVAGETPMVTVTLTDTATGQPVAGSVYTADADPDVGNPGGGLHEAELFVYGPRSHAVPVLTTNSTTDPSLEGSPTQGHSMLLTGGTNEDPQVMTDAQGFKYELTDSIAGLAPGTYMVRFEGGDYGAGNESYNTSSTAVINFQVGTANEEPKIAGDACLTCHGDTVMHLEGAHPHNQAFNTDGCLSCHDTSGNYGTYIGVRVHAVHSASTTGDGHDREWSEITFPQDPSNCTICHTNYEDRDPTVWQTIVPAACAGCHGGDVNAADPDEAKAASHITMMGGDPRSTESAPGCLVCHGEGQVKDLYEVHGLSMYGVSQ